VEDNPFEGASTARRPFGTSPPARRAARHPPRCRSGI
jgi:hypothetical protein